MERNEKGVRWKRRVEYEYFIFILYKKSVFQFYVFLIFT